MVDVRGEAYGWHWCFQIGGLIGICTERGNVGALAIWMKRCRVHFRPVEIPEEGEKFKENRWHHGVVIEDTLEMLNLWVDLRLWNVVYRRNSNKCSLQGVKSLKWKPF